MELAMAQRLLINAIAVFFLAVSGFAQTKPGILQKAQSALQSGDYAKAREYFEAELKAAPADEQSRLGILRVLRETGAYQEARTLAEGFLEANARVTEVHLERARLAVMLGEYAAAERHLRRYLGTIAGQEPATTRIAQNELAELLENMGRKREAKELWEEIIRGYRAGQMTNKRAMGIAALAAWHLGYIQDAKDIFLDATDDKTTGDVPLEALADFGFLFLDKYNAKDALAVFRDCLKINKHYPNALLGIALAKKYESSGEVGEYARSALAVNPNLSAALNLIAELHLQEENYESAWAAIQKAEAVNPSQLDTLSLEATFHLLREDNAAFASVEKRILELNPSHGSLYHTLAENLVMRRKYQEAVDQERKAVRLDPQLWQAYAGMGMNLMRVGMLEDGRLALQRAFEGDPFNIWAFNTLGLLDQMNKFTRGDSGHFTILMSPEDMPGLSVPVQSLAEEVYGNLTERYHFTPKGPIQIEIFPDHEGFAVRTLGLPGLGALGVCFGQVIALDSPRARKSGSFNWGATLWHEFAHVITLQMTRHNIPRWYSEGLSVFEERRARPGWGEHLTAEFVRAHQEGKLLKASELNAGMMRPRFPEQVALSYYQASLVCEMFEQKFGFEKIRHSLKLFAGNKSTEEVFKESFGWDLATLDREHAIFLDAHVHRVAPYLDFKRFSSPKGEVTPTRPDRKQLDEILSLNPADFFANLAMGIAFRSEHDNHHAEAYFLKAQKLFPEFTGPGNPYEALSTMYLEQKREDEALAQVRAWVLHDGEAVLPLIRAAEIYRGRKMWTEAGKMLQLSVYLQPYDQKTYSSLGETAFEAGDWHGAVSAYRILLALHPPDMAGAHYSLARALMESGDKAAAKREVLRALEIAPAFDKALEMLLKISERKDP